MVVANFSYITLVSRQLCSISSKDVFREASKLLLQYVHTDVYYGGEHGRWVGY